MSLTSFLAFGGGIGLFLLGMRLMTDGLKVAAGDTLRNILTTATRSRLRGLAAGVLITAMVQSSSAVIFATIGFVNAGLLTLYQAIGIIYGSNLGTTLTSWIVALLGFNLDLELLAMPFIGIGMALSVAFGTKKYGAIGQALVGLGLFFLGIDVLGGAFIGQGGSIALENLTGAWWTIPLFVGVGILLTVLMQSSSAALAVILTAAAGGLIPLTAAAAMVIGANVGTTSTAAFAVIGATAPAKRAASAHVIFSLVTGVVALLLLPLLLWLVAAIAEYLGFASQMAVLLAIFHTTTKLLGIFVLWPLTGLLVKFLEQRFRSDEENESTANFLDRNIQTAPSLAMNALALELHRMAAISRRLARQAISAEAMNVERLQPSVRALQNLNLQVSEFASGIARAGGVSDLSSALPDALRVGNYLVDVAEHAEEMAHLQARVEITEPELAVARQHLWARAIHLLELTKIDIATWNLVQMQEVHGSFEADYQSLKIQLLRAGTAAKIAPRQMATLLEQMSALHRIVDQATKAAFYLDRYLTQVNHHGTSDSLTEKGKTESAANGGGTINELPDIEILPDQNEK